MTNAHTVPLMTWMVNSLLDNLGGNEQKPLSAI